MKSRIHSFKNAIRGIRMVIRSEKNMQIHLVIAALVVIAGWFFSISTTEWLMCLLCFGLVLGAEIINTAIENLVDLVSPNKHELAGKAKDIAAGAVLVSAIIAACVGLIIFTPKIWDLLFS
ncbi:MAG: diacylglycerol kinase family protein [Paludibacter sp.]|nr:diacylglycerol kinase family protein [Paludibacter sp.]MDD4197829.1 diacylglycerol kinase family protein [Paludibacter sp.]MDD4427872.1 diacylglycerol kinase family protein [Paludibacter sp.]